MSDGSPALPLTTIVEKKVMNCPACNQDVTAYIHVQTAVELILINAEFELGSTILQSEITRCHISHQCLGKTKEGDPPG